MFTACLHTVYLKNKKKKINTSKIKSVIGEMLYIQYDYIFRDTMTRNRRFYQGLLLKA